MDIATTPSSQEARSPADSPQRQTLPMAAVVCTRNRPAMAARALASLAAQAPAPAEILVIDNAPDDDRTHALAQRLPGVRYVREPLPGVDVARNRALAEARQELIAFLDDDAIAAPGWAQAFWQAFAEDARLAVCTGRVEPLAMETEAQRLFEANGGFSRGAERIHLPADAGGRLRGRGAPLIAWAVSVGNGASFAVRRHAAITIGGFDAALDRGPALPGGGDLDLFWRLLQAGYDLTYEPRALAQHEHRPTLEAMSAQLAGHQRALVAFLTKATATSSGRTRLSVAAFLCWRLLKPGARLVGRLCGRDPLPARILARMWMDAWRGLWAYPWWRT